VVRPGEAIAQIAPSNAPLVKRVEAQNIDKVKPVKKADAGFCLSHPTTALSKALSEQLRQMPCHRQATSRSIRRTPPMR